jgi:hypothetical protein
MLVMQGGEAGCLTEMRSVADSVTHERQVAAAIAARGEEIKTHSAEYQWICRGVKPALLPPDKPVKALENPMRKDFEQPQLRARTK